MAAAAQPGNRARIRCRGRAQAAGPADSAGHSGSPDSRRTIFPYYRSDTGFKKVLFVGCAIFTSHYQRQFFADQEFWTLEPEFYQARFGSTNHLIAPIEDASKHFSPGYFDVIYCNGIYGWGVDTLAQGEAAFAQCHSCLRSGGHLVFGWNDVPQRTLSVWTRFKVARHSGTSSFHLWTPGATLPRLGIVMFLISIRNEMSYGLAVFTAAKGSIPTPSPSCSRCLTGTANALPLLARKIRLAKLVLRSAMCGVRAPQTD